MALFKIGDIRPNPFRHIDRYPIQKDKVAALRESLRATGYWNNVVARIGESGHPEIAYGHHRLQALKEHYGPKVEIELIIKDLDDEQMLKIMARENMEEWGHSAAVEHETVRATIEAYAAGRVKLRKPSNRNTKQTWYAPSFRVGFLGEVITSPNGEIRTASKNLPYNAVTLGEFLGWQDASGRPLERIDDALAALAYIEEEILQEADFDGLTRSQGRAVIRQTELARAATEGHAQEADTRRAMAEGDLRDARKAEKDAETDQAREEAAIAVKDAERRVFVEAKKAKDLRNTGKRRAIKTGQHVADSLRGSKRGTSDAAEIAREVQDWPVDQTPPPKIDKYANSTAARLGKVLGNTEPRIAELIKWREHIPQESLGYLKAAFDKVRATIDQFERDLGIVDHGDYIDAEVLEEEVQLQIVGGS